MMWCLMEMDGNKFQVGATDTWCSVIDRGRLCHVNDETYEQLKEAVKVQQDVLLENGKVPLYWSL